MMIIEKLKRSLRKGRLTGKIYSKVADKLKNDRFSFDSIIDPVIIDDYSENSRVTLVLPSLEKDYIYGGLSTALKVLSGIQRIINCEIRIVVLKGGYDKRLDLSSYGIQVSPNHSDLIYMSEHDYISIRKNDIFIATFWNTVYTIYFLVDYQKKKYGITSIPFFYLIQDFEPGFYNWSTRYLLAVQTYTLLQEQMIPIFNSKMLRDYFVSHGYIFEREVVFEPTINKELKNHISHLRDKNKRKKQILIYGRPRADRNLFEIIIQTLRLWSIEYEDARNWRIISLGASFENIDLENNVIECYGKVSIELYSKIMYESYVGISLMESPHPSYPPLEFSTFGIRTITNSFENKDLSTFNDNIISVENCTPLKLKEILISVCNEYNIYSSHFSYNFEYFYGNSFNTSLERICNIISESIS